MKKGRGTILIVEDNLNEQVLIKHVLENLGVTDAIQAVDDGVDAISYLKGEGIYSDRNQYSFPTFLLVDLKMPILNGLELLLFLKRSRLIVVPTIIFTSSADPDDIKKAYLFGANAYHVKPIAMEGLQDQLKMIYHYWSHVELPDLDPQGNPIPTDSNGKLSDQIRHPIMLNLP